jgi:outer membrane receptor protein involved in Fe transport
MRDLIVAVSLPPTQPGVTVFQFQNVGKVHNTGWELEGRVALPASLSAHAAYTLMNSHVVSLGPLYVPSGFWPYHIGEQLRGVPHSSGAATLTYSRARGSIDVTAEHSGQAQQIDYVGLYTGLYQRLNPPGPNFTHIAITPAYTQYHVRVSYVLTPHTSVFAQGDNVTNTRVPGYINYTRTTGRSVMAGIHLQ